MELLIIRAAETQSVTGVESVIDGPLTEQGIKQISLTAGWLNYNFVTKGYVGLTSPYTGAVQSASILSHVTGMPFVVDSNLRDYRPQNNTPITLQNRSIDFANLHWPPTEWEAESVDFPSETPEQFIERCSAVLYKIKELGYDKALLITHPTPSVGISELALGKPVAALTSRVREVAGIDKVLKTNPTENMERHMLLNGTPPCGMTLISGGEVHWFAKVVYE